MNTTMSIYKPTNLTFPRWSVGYDRTFDLLNQMSESLSPKGNPYPPYNVLKTDDDSYTIQLAVAGFTEDDLEIEVKNSVLTIEGSKSDDEDPTAEYLHKGIGARSFTQTFALSEYVVVLDAQLKDGILSISLERQLPEEMKPRKIAITSF